MLKQIDLFCYFGSTIICTEIHFKPPRLKDTKKLKYSISITWRLRALVAFFNPVLVIEIPLFFAKLSGVEIKKPLSSNLRGYCLSKQAKHHINRVEDNRQYLFEYPSVGVVLRAKNWPHRPSNRFYLLGIA